MLPAHPATLYEIEALLRVAGNLRIAGIDEAGRGPLAGSVVAAAVILPADYRLPGLNDSKQLTEKVRDTLFEELQSRDDVIKAVVSITAPRIDEINILQATHEAMRLAVSQLAEIPDLALIDGNPVRPFPIEAINLVKGDTKSAAIAAASVLAKVTRDRQMVELDEAFPEYGFAQHKGYGTKKHLDALRTHGPCSEHRRSFRPVAEAANLLPTQIDLPF